MANKYAVASGAWSSTATWSDTDGGAAGANVPADGDAVFILINVSVLMDADQSAFTGLFSVTIRGHATTPGMLYFADGTSGYLKIRSTYKLLGTTGDTKGRLLVNSNGTWGATGALAFANKAVIDLQGTAYIDAKYLDIRLYGNNPASVFVRPYGTKYDFTASVGTVDVANNTIDLGVSPPADGTPVMITTVAGTLPVGYVEGALYFVRAGSGTKCKLALQNADLHIVDLTGTGSGTITLFTGHIDTGTAVMNVLEDVSGAGSLWVTTAGHNRAALHNAQPAAYGGGAQRVTVSTITSTQVTISENVAQALYPGARLYFASRNVSIRSDTAGNTIVYVEALTSGIIALGCELARMSGTGTTYTGAGIYYGRGHVFTGSIYGFLNALYSVSDSDFAGTICGCQNGIQLCIRVTISGHMSVRFYAMYYGQDCILSGTISSAHVAFQYDLGGTLATTGVVHGCSNAIAESSGTKSYGLISACSGAITYCYGSSALAGTIRGCPIVFSDQSVYTILSALVVGCTSLMKFGGASNNKNRVISRGASFANPPVFTGRNADIGSRWEEGVFCEDYGRIAGASYAFLPTGDVIKNTSVFRIGLTGASLEVIPLSLCSLTAPMLIFEWTEKAVLASAQTRSVYMKGEAWTTFPLATELYVEAEYVSNVTTFARATVVSTAVLADNTTWTEFSLPSFTPAVVGTVRYRGWLKKYVASRKVYVDCRLVGSNTAVYFEDGQSKVAHPATFPTTDKVINVAGGGPATWGFFTPGEYGPGTAIAESGAGKMSRSTIGNVNSTGVFR